MILLLSGRLVSVSGDWIYQVALSVAVYQYGHGRAFLISLIWLVRLIPSLILGPFLGSLADRLGYRRTMILTDLGRMVLVGALALTLNSSTWPIIYPAAFLVSVLGTLFGPASSGIIPSLINSREEQLAANATVLQVGSVALIAGSAVGGVVAGLGYVAPLLLIEAVTFGISALSLSFLRPHPPVRAADESDEEEEDAEESGGYLASFKMLARRPILLFAATVMAVPELVSGAVVVWIVPYAESPHYLNLGPAGVGYLYTAMGVGAVLGGVLAASLGSNLRLDYLLAIAVIVDAAAFGLFGAVSFLIPALVLLVISAMGESVESAVEETLIQQAVPETMIGRAAGTLDSFGYNLMIVGNVLSGFLAAAFGVRTSIIGMSCLSIIVAAYAWWRLYRSTEGQPTAQTLAAIPVFSSISEPVRDWAVRRMTRERYPAGAVIVRQGEEGDRFYIIAKGRAEVIVAGEGEEARRILGPGDFFGEIALLHRVPRTATVRAETALILWELTREDFEELQRRAGQFRESLLETASMRLSEDTAVRLARANFGA
jgi:MFS family permease